MQLTLLNYIGLAFILLIFALVYSWAQKQRGKQDLNFIQRVNKEKLNQFLHHHEIN